MAWKFWHSFVWLWWPIASSMFWHLVTMAPHWFSGNLLMTTLSCNMSSGYWRSAIQYGNGQSLKMTMSHHVLLSNYTGTTLGGWSQCGNWPLRRWWMLTHWINVVGASKTIHSPVLNGKQWSILSEGKTQYSLSRQLLQKWIHPTQMEMPQEREHVWL